MLCRTNFRDNVEIFRYLCETPRFKVTADDIWPWCSSVTDVPIYVRNCDTNIIRYVCDSSCLIADCPNPH